MIYTYAPYQAATYCSGKPQQGNLAVAAFIEEMFPESRLLNIYSCRDIVGGSTLSHHAEGRACDEGCVMTRPPSGISMGKEICDLILPYGKALGIDHSITNLAPWERGRGRPMTYTQASPFGRTYTGLHPHKDHNHHGLTRYASVHLTLATIRWVVLGETNEPNPPTPVPLPPNLIRKGDPMLGLNIGKKGEPTVNSLEAETLQAMLKVRGFPALEVNGRAGDATREALHNWKVRNGITAANSGGQGVIGAAEYAAFNPPQ